MGYTHTALKPEAMMFCSVQVIAAEGSFAGLTSDDLCANKPRSCLHVDRHASWQRLGLFCTKRSLVAGPPG
jgi:hypothetical protein